VNSPLRPASRQPDDRTAVIIGVGQFVNRSNSLDDALEPVALMEQAVLAASTDAGLDGPPRADAVRVVGQLSWRYGNVPRFLAGRLGLEPARLDYTTMGGNSPQSLMNATARQIRAGEIDVAILAGGEATRTRQRGRAAGIEFDWPKSEPGDEPTIVGDEFVLNMDAEIERGIGLPVQFYPMFETAIRAASGRSLDEHQAHLGALYADLSTVASTNPYAWIREAKTADEIITVTEQNRMIGLPYPKLLNSNNGVDMGAAVIMCSVAAARRMGVSEDRWVFPHAGTDCHEHQFVSHRDTFSRTPAIEIGGSLALELAGIDIDDVSVIDLYSCFPAAVQLGAQSLGIDLTARQWSRTGGMTFAGGPWNNYVMHAIATVVDDLRERPGEYGLVWANGGFVTKHSFGVYSTTPTNEFRHAAPQDEIDALPRRALATPADAEGDATVEAYTVMFDREGAPERSIATCLLDDGRRAWGISTDADVTAAMCVGEWVGRAVELDSVGDLHPA
jgi:acetyl-CoA C-acetyltransferase